MLAKVTNPFHEEKARIGWCTLELFSCPPICDHSELTPQIRGKPRCLLQLSHRSKHLGGVEGRCCSGTRGRPSLPSRASCTTHAEGKFPTPSLSHLVPQTSSLVYSLSSSLPACLIRTSPETAGPDDYSGSSVVEMNSFPPHLLFEAMFLLPRRLRVLTPFLGLFPTTVAMARA